MQLIAKPRKKSGYHHGNLKRALLDEALEAIATHGTPSFTLRDLAKRLGVTHPAAYRHFEDKRALLVEISLEGLAVLESKLVEAVSESARAPKRSRISAIIRAYVTFAREYPAHYRVMFGPRLNRDGRFPDLEHALRRAYMLLYKALGGTGESMAANDRRGHDRVYTVWSFAHGYASLMADGRLPLPNTAAAEKHVARLIETALSFSRLP